ncbi:MAG: hypothetical protein LBP93_02660, partial [Treponema sp.]|nr:hypothetical protein [Treponema sp.]
SVNTGQAGQWHNSLAGQIFSIEKICIRPLSHRSKEVTYISILKNIPIFRNIFSYSVNTGQAGQWHNSLAGQIFSIEKICIRPLSHRSKEVTYIYIRDIPNFFKEYPLNSSVNTSQAGQCTTP